MELVYVLLLLAAIGCFVAEAFRGDRTRFDLVALGLTFAVAVPLLYHLQR